MALSLSNFLYAIAGLLFTLAHAETRHYDFDVGWVSRNPDGQYSRPVIGINGEWPIPRIEANVGDRVVVQMTNNLGNESTSIHFHGLFMNGTTHMDGVGSTSQCPVPPGSTFTYNFTIDQPGTYWYHSHIDGQYPDGFRGPLIIHDPENPYADQFDQELVLTLSDWYHDEMPTLISSFISVTNPTGAEPVPDSALMNDTQNLQINVEPGKTYFLRIVNMAAFAAQYFWVEGHTFRIVEVDGVYHEPAEADMLYITAAQRYSILLTTKNTTSENFAIVGSMDQDLFDVVPATLNPNVTSYLVYDKSAALPKPAFVDSFDAVYDDMNLVPYDHEPLLPDPDMSVELVVQMNNLGDGANYAFFNDITYVRQKVPTLYTVLSLPSTSSNGTATTDLLFDPTIYGQTNTHILPHNATIEIILNNHDPGKHPFHLHGHNFQSIARGAENSNDYNPANTTFPTFPMRRDTLLVRPNGHIVMRFKADNPGVWLFHCHIEWHVDSGLVMTFVEAPEMVREQLQGKIPDDHYAACEAGGMAHTGNAAGNTEDYLDLEGANVSIAPLPAGFTARGIVAFVFSCVCGILGIVVVSWYGLGEMGSVELGMEEREIEKLKRELGGGVTGVVTVGSEGK